MVRWILSAFGLSFFSIFLIGCESNPSSSDQDQIPKLSFKGAFIANEGNFLQGNASLSYYDANQDKMYNNVFRNTNDRDLGDVANSICVKDSLAYLVINNSDKIEVITINSFSSIKTINLPSGTSPRHIAFSDDGLLYVTSLYTNKVMVVDPGDGTVETDIDVGANPDGMLITKGFAYVANSGFGTGKTVSVIDLSLNQEVKETKVGDNPQWLELDASGRVHVLCSGAYNDFNNPEDDTPGGVWVINPSDHAVTDSLIMEKGQHPSELSISFKGSGYFIYDAAILEYDTESLQVTDSTFIHMIDGSPYYVRANDISEELFITDAKDFVSPAEVIIFGMNGIEKTRHTVGIIPGYISFINIDEGPC